MYSSLAFAGPQARPGLLGTLPSARVGPFEGPKDTLRLMSKHALEGERSMIVGHFTEWCLRYVAPKDYLSEIIAIRNVIVQPTPFVNVEDRIGARPLFRYTNDPRHVEKVKKPERMVLEINEHGSTLADCDDLSVMAATMALHCGREVEFVAMGFEPGKLSHVAVRVREPKSGRWIWLDGVAGPREREAAGRAKQLAIWKLD